MRGNCQSRGKGTVLSSNVTIQQILSVSIKHYQTVFTNLIILPLYTVLKFHLLRDYMKNTDKELHYIIPSEKMIDLLKIVKISTTGKTFEEKAIKRWTVKYFLLSVSVLLHLWQ